MPICIKMYYIRALLLFVLFAQVTTLPASPSQLTDYKVCIISSGTSAIYKNTERGITDNLQTISNKHINYISFDINDITEQDKQSIRKSDILITIGNTASVRTRLAYPNKTIIHTLIPEQTLATIKHTQHHSYYLFVDQPAERHIKLISLIQPNVKTIGILSSTHNSPRIKNITRAAKKHGMAINLTKFDPKRKKLALIKELIANSDTILTLPDHDAITPSTAKWLIYMAYKKKKSIFAYSKQFVTAGAIASVYSSPYKIGLQTSTILKNILAQGELKVIHYYPDDFEIAVNSPVAESITRKHITSDNIKKRMVQRDE